MAHLNHDEAFYTRELENLFGSAATSGRDLTWYYGMPPGPQLAVNEDENMRAGKGRSRTLTPGESAH
jgi:hypothetical protein